MRAQVDPLAGRIESVPVSADTGDGACDAAVSRAIQEIVNSAGGFGQALSADALGLTTVAETYLSTDAVIGRTFNNLVERIFG